MKLSNIITRLFAVMILLVVTASVAVPEADAQCCRVPRVKVPKCTGIRRMATVAAGLGIHHTTQIKSSVRNDDRRRWRHEIRPMPIIQPIKPIDRSLQKERERFRRTVLIYAQAMETLASKQTFNFRLAALGADTIVSSNNVASSALVADTIGSGNNVDCPSIIVSDP